MTHHELCPGWALSDCPTPLRPFEPLAGAVEHDGRVFSMVRGGRPEKWPLPLDRLSPAQWHGFADWHAILQTMLYDFAAYDDGGHLKVAVEARTRIGTSAEWALQFRRNLLAHDRGLPGELFVIVAPDKIYAWKADAEMDAAPAFEIDARPLLAPYFERAHTRPDHIEPQAFELLVAWWLEDVAREAPGSREGLRESALAKALAGARITRAVAA